MMTSAVMPASTTRQMWSAVGAMALCVAMLIASEFMPVSLLTPIANDLQATQGMAGQAISISGLFAVIASLCSASLASRFDLRHVLLAMKLDESLTGSSLRISLGKYSTTADIDRLMSALRDLTEQKRIFGASVMR